MHTVIILVSADRLSMLDNGRTLEWVRPGDEQWVELWTEKGYAGAWSNDNLLSRSSLEPVYPAGSDEIIASGHAVQLVQLWLRSLLAGTAARWTTVTPKDA